MYVLAEERSAEARCNIIVEASSFRESHCASAVAASSVLLIRANALDHQLNERSKATNQSSRASGREKQSTPPTNSKR
jgi:hypothetical protein